MQVACGALAPVRAAASGSVTTFHARRAGGLLPLRRAAPRTTRRATPGVAVRASMTSEFPAFDAAASSVANLHASVITNDAVASLFQIADASATTEEEIPGLQKGGWLGPITDLLEAILKVCVSTYRRVVFPREFTNRGSRGTRSPPPTRTRYTSRVYRRRPTHNAHACHFSIFCNVSDVTEP